MKLRPLQGIDDLQFGDTVAKAVAIFGDVRNTRTHPEQRCQTTLEFADRDLSLGFDADGGLTFVAVLNGEQDVELWGDRPFEIAKRASDGPSAVRSWIESCGRRPVPHQDCFGGSFEVRDEGVTFCFSSSEPDRLEGIQLSIQDSEQRKSPTRGSSQ